MKSGFDGPMKVSQVKYEPTKMFHKRFCVNEDLCYLYINLSNTERGPGSPEFAGEPKVPLFHIFVHIWLGRKVFFILVAFLLPIS